MATNGQDQTQPTTPEAPPPAPPTAMTPKPGDDALEMGFGSGASFALLQRAARMFSESDLVPEIYQGNIPNCIILLNMAVRMKADPLMVAQNLYIVYKRPGWSGKFLIATVNQSGGFSKLRYEWKGEKGTPEWGCRAWALEKSTGERLDGPWITWKMANDEGWVNKNGSKWKTIPEKMFMLRAGAWFVDVYAPELAMGLPTKEDLDDIETLELVENEPGVYSPAKKEPENGERANTNQADDLTAQLKASRGAPAADPETTKPATEADSKASGEQMTPKAAREQIEVLIADITANSNFSGNAYDFVEQYAGKGIRKVAKIPDDKLGNVIDGLTLEKEKLQ